MKIDLEAQRNLADYESLDFDQVPMAHEMLGLDNRALAEAKFMAENIAKGTHCAEIMQAGFEA